MNAPKTRTNAVGRWTTHKAFCQHCADLKTLCAKGQTLRLIASSTDREHTQPVAPDPYPDEIIKAMVHVQKWIDYLNSDPAFVGAMAEMVCDTSEDYLYDYKVVQSNPRFVFLVNLKHLDIKSKECFLAVTVGPNFAKQKKLPPYYIVNIHRPAGTTTARLQPTPESLMNALQSC